MSKAEMIVWSLIKGGQLGFKFRRQHPVLSYFLDFYCPAAKVALEVDGEQHDPAADAIRDDRLAQIGIQVMRIPSWNVFDPHELQAWLEHVAHTCESRVKPKAEPTDSPS